MRLTRGTIVSLGLPLMVACGGFPFWKPSSDTKGRQADCESAGVSADVVRGSAKLELRDPIYTGESLEGTLLIGAAGGRLCLDKRLVPGIGVSVDLVWDCTSSISEPVPFMIVDYYLPRRRQEDVLILEPGYWYGAPVRVPLFMMEQPTGRRNPDCVEVSLSLNPIEGTSAGSLRVRARREPPVSADGGTPPEGGVSPELEPSPDDVQPGRVWVPDKDSP
jgi:hypothetical protein